MNIRFPLVIPMLGSITDLATHPHESVEPKDNSWFHFNFHWHKSEHKDNVEDDNPNKHSMNHMHQIEKTGSAELSQKN